MSDIKKSLLVKRSLLAMLIAGVLSSVVFVIIEGSSGSISDIFGVLFYVLFLASLAWLAFLFPFLRFLHKISVSKSYPLVFPFLMAAYGSVAFVILFSLVFAREWLGFELFAAPLNILAASVGLVWGSVFMILNRRIV